MRKERRRAAPPHKQSALCDSKIRGNLPLDDNGAPAISAFEAGYSFDITIIVYSLEDIDISAELTEWKEGGKVDIDTDVAPEIY